MVVKGAPEQIWAKCGTILADGEEQPIDAAWSKKFKGANLKLGELGERVLGFCDLWLPEGEYPVPTEFDAESLNFPLEGLRFIGLIALIDPPRPKVDRAILRSRSAGKSIAFKSIDWLIDWSFNKWFDWFFDGSIDWLIDWFNQVSWSLLLG